MLSLSRSSLLLAGISGLLFAQQSQPQWWNLSTVIQHQPTPRRNAAMAVNYDTGHIVLFGGTGASGADLNDTWLWDGTDWLNPSLANSPPPMGWARMVYDSFNRRNVLVGYSSSRSNPGPQTWFWDGTTWAQFTASNPNISSGFSLAYDESSHDVIVFGGVYSSGSWQQLSDDTWAFNGSTWEWLGGSSPPIPAGPIAAASASSTFLSPPARTQAAMAWDRARQQIVLFSGYNYVLSPESWLTDTWVWIDRTSGWQQQSNGNSPPPNWGGYQAAPFLLGGYLLAVGSPVGPGMNMKMETWKRDGANWTLVDAQGPPVSEGFSISEEPRYGGVLFFGGDNNQTWGWGQLPVPLNKAPVAKISAATTVPCTAPLGTSVAFDGGQSYDPDGQPIVSYQWTGPLDTVFGSTASLMLPIGLSTVKLAVSDGQLAGSAIAAVTVTVGVDGLESPLGPLVPEPGSAALPTVSFQAGRTLPLKLGLSCGTWKLSSNEVQPPRLVSIQALGVPVAGAVGAVPAALSTDSGGLFRSENTNWIYNLPTQGMAPGLYAVIIEMPDGLRYRTLISLR